MIDSRLYSSPRFLDCGEAALSVEFGDAVDAEINARALALDDALRAAAPKGVREMTPTYRSLFIQYEPLEISREALVDFVGALVSARIPSPACEAGQQQAAARFFEKSPRAPTPTLPHEGRGRRARWIIPCCYDPTLAEDIHEAAALLGLSPQMLAKQHIAKQRAYMYGFAPGWLYLGETPAALRIARRAAPRGPTPRGAVLIGGGLSLIAANPMPTGWYVIGRTPERMFMLTREPKFLISPGDEIHFEPIDGTTFASLEARAEAGEIVARRIYA